MVYFHKRPFSLYCQIKIFLELKCELLAAYLGIALVYLFKCIYFSVSNPLVYLLFEFV